MSEIDDNYKQRNENLDSEFIENIKAGKGREKSINVFLRGFRKSRKSFEKQYFNFLSKEKRKAMKRRRRKFKNEKFKRFKIKHFDFEFNFFERFKMRTNISFFNFVRIIKRMCVVAVPGGFIYVYYKMKKEIREEVNDGRNFVEKKIDIARNFIIKKGTQEWMAIKNTWTKVVKLKEMFFPKNNKDSKKGEEENSDSSTNSKAQSKGDKEKEN